ncbi:hypothetical protein [Macrococcoides canis]|uniref:hypothetical protein n=1 Tax=Macrococcoides canis TaxID=1855823 RepID=UPI00105B389F|nr:hypothetical protein [Macrococcus canis]TDM23884.1 hypothetical protein ETI02_05640 [Macrococcus canis]
MESLWIDTHIHPIYRKGLNVQETIFDNTLTITIQNPAKENVDNNMFNYFMLTMLVVQGMSYSFGYEMMEDKVFKNVSINIMNFSKVQNGRAEEK